MTPTSGGKLMYLITLGAVFYHFGADNGPKIWPKKVQFESPAPPPQKMSSKIAYILPTFFCRISPALKTNLKQLWEWNLQDQAKYTCSKKPIIGSYAQLK